MSVFHTALFKNVLNSGECSRQAEKAPSELGLSRKQEETAGCPCCHRAARAGAQVSESTQIGTEARATRWLPVSARLCPLTGMVSLCSRKEHLWDDKPPFSGEDGVDHPSDCGISLDLRVPHPSHCCASLLEVSEPGGWHLREEVGADSAGSTLPWEGAGLRGFPSF